ALRSRAVGSLAGTGGMASVPLAAAEVRTRLEPWADRVAVATVNGPASTVVSGDAAAVDEVVAAFQAGGIPARRIPGAYASHSTHVHALRSELLDALAGIRPRRGEVAFYSTLTGGRLEDTSALDPGYWFENLRRTVRFEDATRALAAAGHRAFVEVSPH